MVDFVLYVGSAILVGLGLSAIVEIVANRICYPANTTEMFNSISDKHIRECICFKSDNTRSIDDVVTNLENENVDFEFSVRWD